MKKQTRLFAAVALLVNAFTSLVLFFIFLAKKKSIAGAFAAVALLTGAAGGYLLFEDKVAGCLKGKCSKDCDCEDCDCENCDCEDCECKCSEETEEDDDLDLGSEELFTRDEEEQ